MIEEYGYVERVGDDGTEVRIATPAACERCGIKDACHAAGKVVTVPEVLELRREQPVRLRMVDVSVLSATLVIYGIPFAALLIGLFGSYFTFLASAGEDARILLSFGIGASLLLLSGLVIARLDRRMERRVRYIVEPVPHIPEY